MTLTSEAVLSELDAALPEKSEDWRSTALRQIVDLFLSGAALYTGEQVALFDAVIGRLMMNLNRATLAELSKRLAVVDNAPAKVVGRLARHSDMAVCGPVIEQSNSLPDADLIEIVDKDRVDPTLMMKIAQRPRLSEAVTDILLKRGDMEIQQKVIGNPDARMSEAGFARVIMGINGDKKLAAAIAARSDVPEELRPWLTSALNQ
jgi:uncharacterized protein (DUF2336 family)